MKINEAIIVAAGQSSRLYPRTLEYPKPLLELEGKPILQRSIENLEKLGVTKVIVVVGYMSEAFCRIKSQTSTVEFVQNPFYKHCNNMGSLWFARHSLSGESFFYLHGDIVYDYEILELCQNQFLKGTGAVGLAVEFGETDEEAMKVEINSSSNLVCSSKDISPSDAAGEWIGIATVRSAKSLFSCFEQLLMKGHLNSYDTLGFTQMVSEGQSIETISIDKHRWIEIDFEQDYTRAKELFSK